MLAPYPRAGRRQLDADAEREMGTIMDVVTAIRNVRGEMRIGPGATLAATLRPPREAVASFAASAPLVEALARARLAIDPEATRPRRSALAVVGDAELYVELGDAVDLGVERQRLEKELRRADEALAFLQSKLARPEFVERAPAGVVERERARLGEQEALRAKLAASLRWIDDAGR